MIRSVIKDVSSLAPGSEDAPTPASQALAKIFLRVEDPNRRRSLARSWPIAWRRNALIPIFAGLLLLFIFSFPNVRVAASDFLGLFRVQKFAALSISPEQLALLERIASTGLYPGEIEMADPPGEPRLASSLAEAEALYGQEARLPTGLGQPESVYTIDGGGGRLVVDVDNARAILAVAGIDGSLIPDSLDGQPIDVTIYSGLAMDWAGGVSLVQAPSPLVDYPVDVDVAAIGEAVLQTLGLSPAEAADLAQSIDWTNTLLLPIPENAAQFDEVGVDGETGLALISLDGRSAALLWEREGIVYALTGNDIDQLIQLGNQLD
jgi:hypothetical protein